MSSSESLSNPVLHQYISDEGKVNYDTLMSDPWLDRQIKSIQETDLSDLSHAEEKAFWLNAYNILTLKSVRNELISNPEWEGVLSIYAKLKFFLFRRHDVANRRVSLYTLENRIIRKKYDDPRVHFAINCASSSCPFLPRKLFEADQLDMYLDTLTSDFINEQDGVMVEGETIHVSRIFKWYADDFGGKTKLVEFIREYWQGHPLPKNPKIEFMDYDWSLNSANKE